jgi:hypothetical protein
MMRSIAIRNGVIALFLFSGLGFSVSANAAPDGSVRARLGDSYRVKTPGPYAQAKRAPKVALTADYRGKDRDVVGLAKRPGPDGRKDGHITLIVDTLGAQRVIRSIRLESADKSGEPDLRRAWNSSGAS